MEERKKHKRKRIKIRKKYKNKAFRSRVPDAFALNTNPPRQSNHAPYAFALNTNPPRQSNRAPDVFILNTKNSVAVVLHKRLKRLFLPATFKWHIRFRPSVCCLANHE